MRPLLWDRMQFSVSHITDMYQDLSLLKCNRTNKMNWIEINIWPLAASYGRPPSWWAVIYAIFDILWRKECCSPGRTIRSNIDIVFIWCRGIWNSKPGPSVTFCSKRSSVRLGMVHNQPVPAWLRLSGFSSLLHPNTVHLKGPAGANNRLESLSLGRVKDM